MLSFCLSIEDFAKKKGYNSLKNNLTSASLDQAPSFK